MVQASHKDPVNPKYLARLVAAFLCAALYLGVEWLYLIFKPSFLRTETALGSFEICLAAFAAPAFLTLAIFSLELIVVRTLRLFGYRFSSLLMMEFLQVAILSSLLVVFTDTTFYIFWEAGIVHLSGLERLLGVAAVVAICLYSLGLARLLRKSLEDSGYAQLLRSLSALMLIIPLMALLIRIVNAPEFKLETLDPTHNLVRSPNIIFIAGDGITASHTSAYGYERPTTPFMARLAPKSLLAQNAFPNSCTTTSSVPSLLSGKLPSTTKVVYYPDVFRGQDSYESLPAILKGLGYRNYSVALDIHNPYLLNMRSAFDRANDRNLSFFYPELLPPSYEVALDPARLLLMNIFSRAQERFLHIFGLRDMYDHSNEVNRYSNRAVSDSGRIRQIKNIIRSTSEPFFAHIHLMGTHGPKFFPRIRNFSLSQDQNSTWDVNFYDDAILDFDSYLQEIFSELEGAGKLENTIVVISSDHGMRWTCERTPLLVVFPEGANAGVLSANVQHLDLAPTILSYLGISPPSWMRGRNLLERHPDPLAPLFIASDQDELSYQPPFYDLKEFSLLICQRLYRLNLITNQLAVSDFYDHTNKCSESDLPDNETARRLIISRLREDGYDLGPSPLSGHPS